MNSAFVGVTLFTPKQSDSTQSDLNKIREETIEWYDFI